MRFLFSMALAALTLDIPGQPSLLERFPHVELAFALQCPANNKAKHAIRQFFFTLQSSVHY